MSFFNLHFKNTCLADKHQCNCYRCGSFLHTHENNRVKREFANSFTFCVFTPNYEFILIVLWGTYNPNSLGAKLTWIEVNPALCQLSIYELGLQGCSIDWGHGLGAVKTSIIRRPCLKILKAKAFLLKTDWCLHSLTGSVSLPMQESTPVHKIVHVHNCLWG